MARAEDFRAGDRVFYDSLIGIVPAVVVATHPASNEVTVRYTASRGVGPRGAYPRAFERGRSDRWPARTIVRREWVHRRGGRYVIVEPQRTPNQRTDCFIRLAYLPANARWMFFTGGDRPIREWQPLTLADEDRSFTSRREAISAARRRGLSVDRRGCVSAMRESNPVVAALGAWHMMFGE